MAKAKRKGEIKVHANTSANYLMKDISRGKPKIMAGAQMLLVFGESKTKASKVYATVESAQVFEERTGGSLVESIKNAGDNDVLTLYYMILDKIHDTNYQTDEIPFKYAELCDITGEDRSKTARIQERFLNAASVLYATSIQFEITKGVTRTAHLVRMIDTYRGGMTIITEKSVLPILAEQISKTTHDTALFQANRALRGVIPFGLYLEDQLRRQRKTETVKISAYSAIKSYDLADYLNTTRNYSKRLESLENRLNHLVEINFLKTWQWETNRPTGLDDERECNLLCTFLKPHPKPKDLKAAEIKQVKDQAKG